MYKVVDLWGIIGNLLEMKNFWIGTISKLFEVYDLHVSDKSKIQNSPCLLIFLLQQAADKPVSRREGARKE